MATLLPEWALRRALVLRWPWRPDIWPGAGEAAQEALLILIEQIQAPLQQRGITLELEVPAGLNGPRLASLANTLQTVVSPYADIWVRDCAPFYVVQTPSLPSNQRQPPVSTQNVTAYCTDFNGWAGLDPDYTFDLLARSQLYERYHLQHKHLPIVLEGGSLQTNGEGVIVYVASSIVDPHRNPGLTQQKFENLLYEHFAAQAVIALEHGLSYDETGGHADNLLTFLSPQQVLVSAPEDPHDPEFTICEQLCTKLRETFAALHKPLQIIRAPLPRIYLSAEESAAIEPREGSKPRPAGMPLCATYCNGIRIDDLYIVPQFGVAEDAQVLATLRTHCPELKIIPANSRALLAGGGGWHCASHAVV